MWWILVIGLIFCAGLLVLMRESVIEEQQRRVRLGFLKSAEDKAYEDTYVHH